MDISGLQWDNFVHYILDHTPFIAAMEQEIAKYGDVSEEELLERSTKSFLLKMCERVEAAIEAREFLIKQIMWTERLTTLLEFHNQLAQDCFDEAKARLA